MGAYENTEDWIYKNRIYIQAPGDRGTVSYVVYLIKKGNKKNNKKNNKK